MVSSPHSKSGSRYIRRGLLIAIAVAISTWGCLAPAQGRTVVSLDGQWQIAEGGMDSPPAAFEHSVPVPGLVDMAQTPFADVGVKSARRGAFWYRRTFAAPAALTPVARLKVHKAAYGTRVYLNGRLAGEHLPSFTPGLFDLREALRPGADNELVIRVGADPDALPDSIPKGRDGERARNIPGIYDSVELILSGTPHIENIQTAPDLDARLVRVVVSVRATKTTTSQVSATVRETFSGKLVGAIQSLPRVFDAGKETTVALSVPIDKCRLWSPEDPFLYTMEVATGGDREQTRFGMRTFSLDPGTGRAILNGKPYILRGTNVCVFRFFEDPLRGALPWDEAWVRKLHRAFRSMHWNSIRYCIGFPPELWYRIADEEGLLIQDEFPVWSIPETVSATQLATEYTEWMRERWNHPCVAIWDAQNETVTTVTGAAIRMVRSLDLQHRPWDNGWSPPQAPGDSYECHPYVFNNPSFTLSGLADLPPTHVINPAPNKMRNAQILNEYGWLWLNRDGTPTTLSKKAYENLVGTSATTSELRHTYARTLAALTEYWRSTRRFAGVLHFCGLGYSRPGGATSDNFVDVANLVFEPGFAKHVRDAFSPVGICIAEWQQEFLTGERCSIPVIVTNDTEHAVDAAVRLSLLDEGTTVLEQMRRFRASPLGQSRLSFRVRLPGTSGAGNPRRCRLVAQLEHAGTAPIASIRDIEIITAQMRRAREGVAVGCRASASSTVRDAQGVYPPRNAVDGSNAKRWSSEFSDPQWLKIDLGKVESISRIELNWEVAYAKAYTLEVSTDGRKWSGVYRTEDGKGEKEVVSFSPVKARMVRLVGTKRATRFGYSLWEMRVFP